MRAIALATLLGLTTAPSVFALDCPINRAIYTQNAPGWVLTLSAPGEDGAANEFAAVTITAPNGITPFEGGIYQPNGFGSTLLSLSQGCPADDPDAEECRAYEGTLYALGAEGIEMLPLDFEHRSAPAPRQLLLPDFAAGRWYSLDRDKAFTETDGPSDVFTLSGCHSP